MLPGIRGSDLGTDDYFAGLSPEIKGQYISHVIMIQIFFIERAHALGADKNDRKAGRREIEFTKRRFRRLEDLALRDWYLLLEIF